MLDLEYLLNPNLNPLEQVECYQILSEISELYNKILKNQETFGVQTILVPKDAIIPTINEGGSIVYLSTPKRKYGKSK